MTALEILSCGPATSIQDLGRPGYARIGLPAAGAMDPRALRTANALVGNAPDDAALELVFQGLTARAQGGPLALAVAGAPAAVRIDGLAMPHQHAFLLQPGATLTIGAMSEGIYAMLAVAGGIAVKPALDSRSLDARARIGGLEGRALQPGDRLPVGAPRAPFVARRASASSVQPDAPIRIVMGPQEHAFTERGLQTLLGRPFAVSHAIDRMAYRLEGPLIERKAGFEMISDGTLPGSIQVPPDGHPLVLMADRQTVGGYPKIATVISADLGRLAQRRPGAKVEFLAISAEEAREIARQQRLSDLAAALVSDEDVGNALAGLSLHRIGDIADAVIDASDSNTWDLTQGPATVAGR